MNITVHRQALAEVESELVPLLEKIRALNAVADYHRAKITATNGTHADSGEDDEKPAQQAPPAGGNGEPRKQIDYIVDVLKQAGRPLKTAQIVDGMFQRGFKCPDVDKLKRSIFTTLIRSPKIEKVGTGMWGLAE